MYKKIQRLALARGWNRSKLAEASGFAPTTVGPWWNGDKRPDVQNALSLARVLNVPLEYLVDDALDDPPPASSPIASDERALLDLLRQMEVPARAVREALVRGGTAILSGATRGPISVPMDVGPGAGGGGAVHHDDGPHIGSIRENRPGPETGKPVGLAHLSDRIDPQPARPKRKGSKRE